jgi:D-alanine-D-alanine ligase-like ATP-grasp enzyme
MEIGEVVILKGVFVDQDKLAASRAKADAGLVLPGDNLLYDRLLATEVGTDEQIAQIQQAIRSCGLPTAKVLQVSLKNTLQIVASLAKQSQLCKSGRLCVLNLCDGTESDGYPGISVVKALEQANLCFTGAGADFFEITTSKIEMKKFFCSQGVATSPFTIIRSATLEQDLETAATVVGFPMILKLSELYSSIGISDKSVVSSIAEARERFWHMKENYEGNIFVEKFLDGREFTALVCGSYLNPDDIYVYTVPERVFASDLSGKERMLSFDRYYAGYGIDGLSGTANRIYEYACSPEALQKSLKKLAKEAFIAVKGTGYGRVDIRSSSMSGDNPKDLFVLEVNSNCGMSFDRESSLGEILWISKIPACDFMNRILSHAMHRLFPLDNGNISE